MDMETDIVIIGGGINGVGVARDLAKRGVGVTLFEKRDFAAGTTGGSSGMIHGGARYLTHSRRVTRHSCVDSGHIRRIAPHLVFRIPFLVPIFRGAGARIRALLFHTFFEAYDRFQRFKGGKPATRLSAKEAYALEPGLAPGLLCAVTFDEWGIDPFRLALANAVDAAEHGAVLRSWTRATDFITENGRVAGVRFQDALTGERGECRARLTLNLAGPWSERVAGMGGARLRLRPAKGVHLILDRRVSNVGVVCTAVDGRSVFFMPHENSTLVGTTDDDYYGDPDDVRAAADEIAYLLEACAAVFPSIRRYRVMRAMAAIRPTLWAKGRYEDDLSRAHRIFDHERLGGPAGLVSMAGGKLAAYRLMCQELADLAAARLGNHEPCQTHLDPLPGGETPVDLDALARETGAPMRVAARAAYRLGCRAKNALRPRSEKTRDAGVETETQTVMESETRAAPSHGDVPLRVAGTVLCQCEPVTVAELRSAIHGEGARTASDLRRRTQLATGPCQGTRCTLRAAALLGMERGEGGPGVLWQARELFENRWKGHRAVATGTTLAQLQYKHALLVGVAGLDRWAPALARPPARASSDSVE